MSISGASSYVPTTREFLTSWEGADSALPPASPLVLPAGTGGFQANVTRADLEGLLEAVPTGLIPLRAAVEEAGNLVETSASQLAILKAGLLERVVEFNAYVRTWFENTKWPASLPLAPGMSGDESTFTRPLDDVAAQWRTMEAETGNAIVLKDEYGLPEFTDAVADLQGGYAAWSAAGQQKKMAIQTRIAMQDRIYAVLKKYREVVPLRFAKDAPVVLSLPRLTPVSGHTPAAVVLTGLWNAAEAKAELGWTASTEVALKHYQVRYCTSAVYNNEEEEILATVSKGGPLTLLTAAGLSVPGAVASFKVFVVLESDNEKGSEAVAVTRPE